MYLSLEQIEQRLDFIRQQISTKLKKVHTGRSLTPSRDKQHGKHQVTFTFRLDEFNPIKMHEVTNEISPLLDEFHELRKKSSYMQDQINLEKAHNSAPAGQDLPDFE